MVDAPVSWSFGILARKLSIYLLQQALSGSGNGGERMEVCLGLAVVSVVVARWSRNILIFIIFWAVYIVC
jgi:hypothetical protein